MKIIPSCRGITRAQRHKDPFPRPGRRKSPLLATVALLMSASTALGGCAYLPQLHVRDGIDAYLKEYEGQRRAMLDFDRFIAGEWQRAVLVCRGSTANAAEEKLQVSWPDMPDVNDSKFAGFIAFVTETSVESHIEFGQEFFFRSDYFSMCLNPLGEIEAYSPPVTFSRSESIVMFTFYHGSEVRQYWYASPDEIARLREGG